MKIYHRISLGLTLLALVAWLFLASQPMAPARNGFGPSGEAILALLAWSALVALLLHSCFASLIFAFGKGFRSLESKWGMGINVLVLSLMAFPWASDAVDDAYRRHQFLRSDYNQMMEAIEQNNVAAFRKRMDKADSQNRRGIPNESDMIYRAADSLSLDVLKAMKARGIVVANDSSESSEKQWSDYVIGALKSDHEDRRNLKLETVKWLLEEGAPHGFDLRASSAKIFAGSDFALRSFRDIEDPKTVALFDLVVKHGADLNACGDDCPLWYMTRFEKVKHVEFLVSRGADVNYVDESLGTSVLVEAVENLDVEIARILLNAGAAVTFTQRRDALLEACRRMEYSEQAAAREMLLLLKKKGVAFSKDQIDAFEGQLNATEAACLRRFL